MWTHQVNHFLVNKGVDSQSDHLNNKGDILYLNLDQRNICMVSHPPAVVAVVQWKQFSAFCFDTDS